MEAQIPRQHVYNGDEAMQGVDDGHHDQEHHEKKSVVKNVKNKAKAKAKKIKETLTKHGHGHEHDHDHHSHEEDDDDDDDDEELVEDPEVHGAPMYESAAVRSGVGAGHQVGVNLEKPTMMEDDRYKNTTTDAPTRPFSQSEHAKPEQGQFKNTERGVDENKGNPRVRIGTSTQMEEDPHAPKDRHEPSNYQTKVADPTNAGGAEAGITPIIRSFDKMSVYDEPIPDETPKMFTGSHDQFSPEPIPENAPLDPKDPGSALKPLTGEKQSSYTEKISSATSALTGKAVAAKNIVASKLGYGEKGGPGISTAGGKEGSGISGEKVGSGISTAGGGEQSGGVTTTVADYAHRAAATVTETLAPVTGKVTDVGSTLLSKVQGGPTGDHKTPTKETEVTIENKETSKGVTGYLAEKLRPSKEDKALSEVISSTLYRKKPESEEKPMGKATVSDEVASRLGTMEEDPKREQEGVDAGVVANVRPDMVERVKGWFGMGQSQSSQPSQGDTNVGNESSLSAVDSGGERRLQESAN